MNSPLRTSLAEVERCVQEGNLEEAKQVCERKLAEKPSAAGFLFLLGVVLHRRGDSARGITMVQRAIEKKGKLPRLCHTLAIMLKAVGRYEEALQWFRKSAAAGEAKQSKALLQEASVLRKLGRTQQATCIFQKAIEMASNASELAEAHYKFGRHLISLRPRQESDAIAHYEAAIAADLTHKTARFWLAAATGDSSGQSTSPQEYVRLLYEGYAKDFEEHLTGPLQYNTPQLVATALKGLSKGPFGKCVDLGCGTGLSGLAVKDQVKSLVGVDLSPAMLEQARKKNIYEKIMVGDCEAALLELGAGAGDPSPDLFIACDVFCYVGDLASIFRAINSVAAPAATFAFSTEAMCEVRHWTVP
ncbi:unnamed protein product, partial [Chrysoparadoxa australica]